MNSEVTQMKQNLDNLNYIEKLAREEHNMVRKGEIPLFIIEDKDKKTTDVGKNK